MSESERHAESGHAPAPLTGCKADLHGLFVALIKVALVSEASEAASWRADALEAQRRLAAATRDVMLLRVDGFWALSVKTAESDPVVRRDETVNPMLPTMSPIRLEQLTAHPFDLDAAVQTIRDVASFG